MKRIITFNIEIKALICLILAFIFATVIGTVTHEYGHFFAAKFMGIEAKVHYAYTSIYQHISKTEEFIFTLGGPLQTMTTGTIGLILLYANRSGILRLNKLKISHWTFVFLALFWLRQPANFAMYLIGYLITGKYSKRGDEIQLADYLNMPDWSIAFATAAIGVVVAMLVIFKFIPVDQRFTFIISGLIGGTLGFYSWLMSLGEVIMP